MRRIAMAAIAALLLPAAASSQGRGTPSCKDAAQPFALAAQNRLTGPALRQAVSGKTLVYIRESIRTPGVWVNNRRDLRADGSMVYTCQYGRRREGPWRPCRSFGSQEKRVEGARDVGVWSIRGDALCGAKASFGEKVVDCFAIHRQGTVFAARRVSGPLAVCMQGTIALE
ncbi:MAG: hypothetical protein KIT16_23750 [Rhodospirillaceae bacterium]|nr:hypothetical protein [Rhodospirillaceae bacterium]